METTIELIFRFVGYTFFGLTLEMLFSVHNIDLALGHKVKRRVPFKYLEGFVSVYMIPLHGLGLLFLFEPVYPLVADWFVLWRYLLWCLLITVMEVLWGMLLRRVVGFYTWDYYADSKYRVFKHGYTLWTLIPLWGISGLIIEKYSQLLIHLSPHVVRFVLGAS